MLCDVGPNKLTLLQVVGSTAQPFKYAQTPSTSNSIPPKDLRHVADKVLPWLGVEEQACAFRESLPATPALYDRYMPTTLHPYDEGTALMLLGGTLFSVANQLGDVPGLAAIKFNEFPGDFDLAGKRISLVCMHQAILLGVFTYLLAVNCQR